MESLFVGQWFIDLNNQMFTYFVSVAIVSIAIIVALGMPAYFALKHKKWNNIINVMVVGALIPAVIILGLEFAAGYDSGFSSGENLYGHYRSIIESGKRTYWGWIKILEQLFVYGIHGCVGAYVFHKLYMRGSDA